MAKIVIGIDGGGTYTRVVAADVFGRILAIAKGGGASPHKTTNAQENVQNTIYEAIVGAGHTPGDVVELVAGIAGLDNPKDQEWAEKFTALPGLECSRLHVNDAVVAHAGALQSQPGIIVISGTGSIVFGVTKAGQHIRNYDFHHYAHSSARALSYEAVHRLLAGNVETEDGEFTAQILAFWQAKNLTELRERGSKGFVADSFERNRLFGEMAPLVTEAAEKGAPLARAVCVAAAEALGVGIRLLGNCFAEEAVSIALIGSVVQTNFMRQRLDTALLEDASKHYQTVAPAFSSEIGAVLMALARHGIAIDESVLAALRAD